MPAETKAVVRRSRLLTPEVEPNGDLRPPAELDNSARAKQ